MSKVVLFAQSIISQKMDEYGAAGKGQGVESPHFQYCMSVIDDLAIAHQVLEEHGHLTKVARGAINAWLHDNVEGVHPDDVSEAAEIGFVGDLELIGGLYMLVQHSHKLERLWEDIYDTDWTGEAIK